MPDLPMPGFVPYRPVRPDPATIVQRATDPARKTLAEVMIEVGAP